MSHIVHLQSAATTAIYWSARVALFDADGDAYLRPTGGGAGAYSVCPGGVLPGDQPARRGRGALGGRAAAQSAPGLSIVSRL